MRKIIHKLRQKPEKERRHILHICIFLAAILMIFLWIFSLNKNLTNSEIKIKAKKDLQPFTILRDDLVNSTKENIE